MKKMKRLLTTLLIALVSFVAVVGCSKPDPLQQPNNDEYYVKYEFKATNNVGYGSRYWNCNISFTGEKGQVDMGFQTINNLSYEVVTGPFKYGSKVYATLDGGGFPNTSIQIFVSKNDSPFALKGMTNEGRLEYTIDY